MGLKMEVEEGKENIVFKIAGELNIANAKDFKTEIFKFISQGYNNFLLDFRELSQIDSSGLAKLLLINKRVTENEGMLEIRNISNHNVYKLFDNIYLDNVLNIQ